MTLVVIFIFLVVWAVLIFLIRPDRTESRTVGRISITEPVSYPSPYERLRGRWRKRKDV